MSGPYRVNMPGGVKNEATGEIIYPGDPGWGAYLEWLATAPPGALLPFVAPVPPVEQQQAEAFARVTAATATQRTSGTMDALGHTWRIDAPFLIALSIHNAAPGLPTGFALPDVNYELVPLTQGDLNALLHAASNFLFGVEGKQADYIRQIHASPHPLDVEGLP